MSDEKIDDIDMSVGDMPTMRGDGEQKPSVQDMDMSVGDMPTMRGDDNKALLARIDRYELINKLGRGAFGAVFLARDTVADTLVALKTLPPELNHSVDDLDGVKENFKLVSKLAHPNIAQLKYLHHVDSVTAMEGGVHIAKGEYLVVMEYVEGSTLQNWLKQFPEKKVPLETVKAICQQIAIALDFAHSLRVIHRDIKPGNIMVTQEKQVKVLDFGLAAEVRSSMSRLSTDKGSSSGTRPYMPPEQLMGRLQDHTADQYALAVVVYEMLSGGVPFKSVFETGDMALICQVIPNNPAESLKQLNKKQNAVLLRALAKSKEERFSSCVDFMNALDGVKITKTSKDNSKNKKPLYIALSLVLVAGLYFGFRSAPKDENEKADRVELLNKETQVAKQDEQVKQKAEAAKVEEQAKQKAEAAKREAQAKQVAEANRLAQLKAEQEGKAAELERARLKKLDQEKQAAVEAAWLKAKSAYDQDKLSESTNALVNLFNLEVNHPEGRELEQLIVEKAGLKEIVPLKAKVEIARTDLKEFDIADGFGQVIQDLDVAISSGQSFLNQKEYAEAMTHYKKSLQLITTLEKENALRNQWQSNKSTYDKARSSLDETKLKRAYPKEFGELTKQENSLEKSQYGGYEKALNSLNGLEKNLPSWLEKQKAFAVFEQKYANLLEEANTLRMNAAKWQLDTAGEKALSDLKNLEARVLQGQWKDAQVSFYDISRALTATQKRLSEVQNKLLVPLKNQAKSLLEDAGKWQLDQDGKKVLADLGALEKLMSQGRWQEAKPVSEAVSNALTKTHEILDELQAAHKELGQSVKGFSDGELTKQLANLESELSLGNWSSFDVSREQIKVTYQALKDKQKDLEKQRALTASRAQFRGGPERAKPSSKKLSGTYKKLWSFETGGNIHSSPSVADGVVYVGSWDDNVYAISCETGKKIWSFETGSYVLSSPCVADGVVYVGSYDDHVYAISSETGKEIWRYKTGDIVHSSPSVVDGVVYVGSHDKKLYAISCTTGKKLWSFETSGVVSSLPSVVDGVVYIGSTRYVYALSSATGKVLWTSDMNSNVSASLSVVDGVVYGCGGNKLFALSSKTGEKLWTYKIKNYYLNSPYVVDGVIYVADTNTADFPMDNGSIYAINIEGRELWTYKMGSYIRSSPCVVDGVVYVGSWDNNVYAFSSKTGEKLWTYDTGRDVASSPAVVDGVLYIGSDDDSLHALDLK